MYQKLLVLNRNTRGRVPGFFFFFFTFYLVRLVFYSSCLTFEYTFYEKIMKD